jgi:hypothetical protein
LHWLAVHALDLVNPAVAREPLVFSGRPDAELRTMTLDLINGAPITFVRPRSDENARLINQSGLFTRIRGLHATTVEEQIKRIFPRDFDQLVLLKIHIANSERVRILQDLNRMNINHASLFPDLTGAGRFSNFERAVYRPWSGLRPAPGDPPDEPPSAPSAEG